MLRNLILPKLFCLLEFIPWRSKLGFSLVEKLKYWYYYRAGQYKKPPRCLCGGRIITMGIYPDGWVTDCNRCGLLIDED